MSSRGLEAIAGLAVACVVASCQVVVVNPKTFNGPTTIVEGGSPGAPKSPAGSQTLPVITGLTVEKTENSRNLVVRVQAQTADGGPITIAWRTDCGDLSTLIGPSTLWRAPKDGGSCTLKVAATTAAGFAEARVVVSAEGAVGEALIGEPVASAAL